MAPPTPPPAASRPPPLAPHGGPAYFLRGVSIGGVYLEFLTTERFVGRVYRGQPTLEEFSEALTAWGGTLGDDEARARVSRLVHAYAELVGPFAATISLMVDARPGGLAAITMDGFCGAPTWLVASYRATVRRLYGWEDATLPALSDIEEVEALLDAEACPRMFDDLTPSIVPLLPKAYELAGMCKAYDHSTDTYHFGVHVSGRLAPDPVQRKVAGWVRRIFEPARRMCVATPLLSQRLEERLRRQGVAKARRAVALIVEEAAAAGPKKNPRKKKAPTPPEKKKKKKKQQKAKWAPAPPSSPSASAADGGGEADGEAVAEAARSRGWEAMMRELAEAEAEASAAAAAAAAAAAETAAAAAVAVPAAAPVVPEARHVPAPTPARVELPAPAPVPEPEAPVGVKCRQWSPWALTGLEVMEHEVSECRACLVDLRHRPPGPAANG